MAGNFRALTGETEYLGESLAQEMAAFDSLSPELRELVRHFPTKGSALSLIERYGSDYARKIAIEAKRAKLEAAMSERLAR